MSSVSAILQKKTFYVVVIASLIGIIDGGQWPSWILNIVNFNNYRPFLGGELGLSYYPIPTITTKNPGWTWVTLGPGR